MRSVARYANEGGVGVITVDSPPVNALGAAVRQGLQRGLDTFLSEDAVEAIVIICAGRTFFAGADISEFGKPSQPPTLPMLIERFESSRKPIVAAIHGTGLGGGFELALACHYRLASASARVGLPEVALGLLPGAGGTQRVPRLIGVERALDMITSGRHIGARDAHEWGLVDGLVEEDALRAAAISFAKQVLSGPNSLRRLRDLDDKVAVHRGKPDVFAAFRKANARAFRGFKAPESIIQCIEAAAELPFEDGLKRESALFRGLLASSELAAQRYFFFAERQTVKVPDIPTDISALPVRSVGVIGAGTMGGGIAMNFLNAGIPVTLVELKPESLNRGLAIIRKNYETTVRRGRLSQAEVERRMALIVPALDLDTLSQVDLVIEAVFESMPLKKEIFSKLDTITKPGAILASNTSYLDVDEIASVTSRPEHVLGMHFFSPANVMRLLEVVRGAKTDPAIVATAMKLAKPLGKIPVLARVCRGFIANRLMNPRGRQAEALVLAGIPPQAIDRALYNYGFAVGPFQMMDMVGLDVIGRDFIARTLNGDLVKLGRLGQKQGGGYYDYDENRVSQRSPVAAEIIAAFARDHNIAQLEPLSEDEIVARLLYPVVNEGARVLEERIALRGSDIDVAAVMGYNWPIYTGGPMLWADQVGLDKVVSKLKELAAQNQPAFNPASLLERLAISGGRLSEFSTAS